MHLAVQSRSTTPEVITIIDVRAFLVRRLRLIAVLFVLVLGAAATITFLTPKEYESQMKLLIKNDRADLVISANDRMNGGAPSDTNETAINSELELIRSRDIMREVVIRCGLDRRTPIVPAGATPTPAAREAAIGRLQRKLTISAVKKSNIIYLSYLDSTAEGAKHVLDVLADVYLAAHLRLHGSPGTETFFREQAQTYGAQLRTAEEQLSKFRQNNDLSTFEQEEKDALLKNSLEVQRQLEEAEASVEQQANTLTDARRLLAAERPRLLTQARTAPEQYSIDRLSTMIVELRNRRTEMAAKFRSDDILVTQLDEQINETQKALDIARTHIETENTTDVNPLNQTLQKVAADAQLSLTGAKARATVLTAQLGRYHARLAQLERVTTENDELTRAVKDAETTYQLYVKKEEEARIARSLDDQKIANVVIAEHATAPPLAAKPQKAQDLALGFVLACFLSLGTAVAMEYFSAHSGEATKRDSVNTHLIESSAA